MGKETSGQRKALTVPFDPESLTKFSAICERAGISMAEMIRAFVDLVNANGLAGEVVLDRLEDGSPVSNEDFPYSLVPRMGVLSLALEKRGEYRPFMILRPGGAMAAYAPGVGWCSVGVPGLDVLMRWKDENGNEHGS